MELLLGPRSPKTHTGCNIDSGEGCVSLKAALHTSVLYTNSRSRGNDLSLLTNFHFGVVWLSFDVAEWWVLSLFQQLLESALVCPKLPLAQSKIVPSLFTQKLLENSYTFQWFLFSWKDFWDHSVQRLNKRKAHYQPSHAFCSSAMCKKEFLINKPKRTLAIYSCLLR